MPISLLTLNVEGDRHNDRWLPVASGLNLDVLCLQELFKVDCDHIAQELQMWYVFAPTVVIDETNRYGFAPKGEWGVGLFSKLPVTSHEIEYYVGGTELKVHKEPNDPSRALISVTVRAEGKDYTIATTHFTWSPEGATTDVQLNDFEGLKKLLKAKKEYVLCGDFNAPRGKKMFNQFLQLGLKDNLPLEVTSTIDETLHYAQKKLELAVDNIFTTPGYTVSDVQILKRVSDHKGISATIEKQ